VGERDAIKQSRMLSLRLPPVLDIKQMSLIGVVLECTDAHGVGGTILRRKGDEKR